MLIYKTKTTLMTGRISPTTNTNLINSKWHAFSSLIKVLKVLILDFDDYLQDNNRLGEAAYLINDQILALLTAYSMYFLMFNQSTESATSGYW